jgi:hypothetical protein
MQVKQTRSVQRADGNNQRTGATGAHVTFRATVNVLSNYFKEIKSKE